MSSTDTNETKDIKDKKDGKEKKPCKIGKFFKHFKNYPANQLITLLILPVTFLYYELFFRFFSTDTPFDISNIAVSLGVSVVTGIVLDLLCSISKSRVFNGILCAVFMAAGATYTLLHYFVERSFNIYMNMSTILAGAGGIATEAGGTVADLVWSTWPLLLLFYAPTIIYLVFFIGFKKVYFMRMKALGYIQLLIIAILAEVAVSVPLCNDYYAWQKLTYRFDYDESIRTFGLNTASKVDIFYSIFDNPFKQKFVIDKDNPKITLENPEEYNVIEFDFDKLKAVSNDNAAEMMEYIESIMPSKKNEMTGIFKGKNLIQITGETFTQYAIDPDLTPTLYKLSQESMQFEHYYQPLYSGSTTTAEFLILLGLMPFDGYNSMYFTQNKYLPYTIGQQLLNEGYVSLAFHNGKYNYFNRNLTHCNLGYTQFTANGNGMTGLTNVDSGWPQSDVEMMEYIFPEYLDEEPFNLYIMTLSGHSKYDYTNFIGAKHIAYVRKWAKEHNKDYTDPALYYLAGNYELELAMQYMMEVLEERDLLDDTVIVMTGDHYPYSLTDKYEYDDNGKLHYYDITRNINSLFEFEPETDEEYNRNVLFIWSKEIAESDPIVVSEPVCSCDILPTVSNMFGVEFDSRMMIGRDVFDKDTQPLVIFSNYSWLTEVGYYNIETDTLTLNDGTVAGEDYADYVAEINTLVQNKMIFSRNVIIYDFYRELYQVPEGVSTQEYLLGVPTAGTDGHGERTAGAAGNGGGAAGENEE
ncbi:MAG: sulfatase-like hydrolase/transferase [Parasporobacterium sp.]|nr:sulfatase-like hydrolase/transferase [Parasporobacterium sp.]